MSNQYTLRISVTNTCNLNCAYCNPKRRIDPALNLSDLELIEIIEAGISAGVTRLTWTGGEPTTRKNFVYLVREATKLGITDQHMTTNGSLYHFFADPLKQAGISRVNFSLDTLNRQEFRQICGADRLPDVIKSIDTAASLYSNTKFNSVITQSNRHVFKSLVEFTEGYRGKLTARFLEMVPCGQLYEDNPFLFDQEFLPIHTLLFQFAQMGQLVPLINQGDVRGTFYFRIKGYQGIYGLNPNYSKNYRCDGRDCRKLRLNPEGYLSNCTIKLKYARLLKGKTLTEKKRLFKAIVAQKQNRDYSGFKHTQKYYDFWRFGIKSPAITNQLIN